MGSNTRDNLLTVRCNDAEYEAIKQLAKKRGLSISDLVRTLAKEGRGEEYRERGQALVDKSKALLDRALDERAEIAQQEKEAVTALNKTLAILAHIESLVSQVEESREKSKERDKENIQ